MSDQLPVRIVSSAARAITEAAQWWSANRPKAPAAFVDELERALQLIASQPSIGARALNVNLAGVRRIHLSRVHYHLYYRFTTSPRPSKCLRLGILVAARARQFNLSAISPRMS